MLSVNEEREQLHKIMVEKKKKIVSSILSLLKGINKDNIELVVRDVDIKVIRFTLTTNNGPAYCEEVFDKFLDVYGPRVVNIERRLYEEDSELFIYFEVTL